jgi:alanine racemase
VTRSTASLPAIEDRLEAAGLPPLPRTAWLELDLDAVRANVASLRRLAGSGVPIHPVVKADAYGHGSVPIARALEDAGVDGLCVATIDEAAELRAAGVTLPVLVLYPVPGTWAAVAAHERIALSVGDATLLERLLAGIGDDDDGMGGAAAPLELQLEVETGLGRGGVGVEDVARVVAGLARASGIRLTGLWTHLQASEDAARTAAQLARFEAAIQRARASGLDLPPRHVAASGGLLADVAAYDGVRPGLTVYGLIPDELERGTLAEDVVSSFRPVLSLHARPVRVADLPAGWGVSYGPTFVTARPSRIATLPLGYGDGWSRALSNRADALVRGMRVPIVGNVAMDAIMVDVTDVPGPAVGPDDLFTLIGSQGGERIEVADVARTRTTNSWEVVTGMARRLPRVYHSAAGPVAVRFLAERSA